MTTQTQSTPSKSPKPKPILNKYVNIRDANSLAILQKRSHKLRSLIIQADLWKSMMTNPNTLNTVKEVLNTSKVLKSFRIHPYPYDGCFGRQKRGIVNGAVVRVIESLKHNPALESTYFHFGQKEPAEEALCLLTRHVGHVLGKLRNFSLQMNLDWRKSPSMTNGGLRRLRFLQNITLKVPWGLGSEIDPFAVLKESLFGCKGFSIEMLEYGWRRNDDTIIQNLAKSFQRFICVQNLRIKLNFFHRATIGGMRPLFEVISQMSLLEGVHLEFDECGEFASDCLKNLIENLSKLLTLKRLDLSFNKCSKIENKEFVFFSKNLQEFEQLAFLRLNFSRCSQIEVGGLFALKEALQNMKSLQEVHLILQCCTLISAEGVERFVKDFKDFPMSLKIAYQSNRNEKEILITNKNWALQEEKEEEDFGIDF